MVVKGRPMKAEQFILLVKTMRRYQKAYFKDGRKQSDLIMSKTLEQQVDQALAEGISIPVAGSQEQTGDESEQLNLFGE
jgi:hypothetical protein